jgi:hypothetical protein
MNKIHLKVVLDVFVTSDETTTLADTIKESVQNTLDCHLTIWNEKTELVDANVESCEITDAR